MIVTLPHPLTGDLIEVEYVFHGRIPGLHGGHGEPETPDEEESVGIVDAWMKATGEKVNVSDCEREIADAIFETL